MSVGIPGTGVGGLFYLISGLLIPAREILAGTRKAQRRARRWRLVVRQTFLVTGILAGIWITGWILGVLITQPLGPAEGVDPSGSMTRVHNLWGTAAVLAGLGTLGLVLSAVEAARFFLRRKRPSIASRASPSAAAAGASDAA
ncbi:MAG: hypothetical protein KatS3mg081_2126 [Gemmatimonadales bacterium]|nr:hypothetical protein HRbin33_01108 [bacterium HR33]GIW52771.1 MAG: hypothetical protein KatS3mg081_2126 [Gemmatimonadales bacterium]